MERTKNKDVFKNLYTRLAKSNLHYKRYEKTKQKPNEGKLKTDLSQQIESGCGIIPDVKVQNTVDENPDEKFCHRDECGAEKTAQEKGHPRQLPIDKTDHRQAKAACQNHGGVRVSPPKKLQHTVSDAAHQHTDDAVFPFPPTAMLSK
jgi:hypothetical protein